MTLQELNLFFNLWLTELNPSFEKYDSKNWTLLFKICTQRIEPLFKIWLEELNMFFNRTFSIWLKRFIVFNMFWRVEPFFDMTYRIDFFRKIFQIWTLFEHDSKNWTFFIWFKYLSLILQLTHRIDFFSKVTLRIEFFFWKKTQRIERIEPFLDITQKIELFFVEKMTRRIELFFCSIWLKELFLPFFHDSNTWTFFHMTQIIEPSFLRHSNTWTFLKIFDSKKWTLFFQDSKFFHQEKKNSQNWMFLIRPTELNFFCELNH